MDISTSPDGGESHPVNFATPPSPENQNTPRRGFTVLKIKKQSVKNFIVCGELSSILLFNFVHNFINYMRAIDTEGVKIFHLRRAFADPAFEFRSRFHSLYACDCDKIVKEFCLRRALSMLLFNFAHDFINYMRAIVTKAVKKFRL